MAVLTQNLDQIGQKDISTNDPVCICHLSNTYQVHQWSSRIPVLLKENVR